MRKKEEEDLPECESHNDPRAQFSLLRRTLPTGSPKDANWSLPPTFQYSTRNGTRREQHPWIGEKFIKLSLGKDKINIYITCINGKGDWKKINVPLFDCSHFNNTAKFKNEP